MRTILLIRDRLLDRISLERFTTAPAKAGHPRPPLVGGLLAALGVAALLGLVCLLPLGGPKPAAGSPSWLSEQANADAASSTLTRAMPSALPAVAVEAQPAAGPVWPTLIPDAANVQAVAPQASAVPAPFAQDGAPPQRVVYLIDVSGSLIDIMPDVVDWMGDALEAMAPRTRFSVIFFRKDQFMEVPPAGLKPATFRMRATAWGWMQPASGHVRPFGRSDVTDALAVAMQYEPTQIHILSDDRFSQWSRWGDGAELLDYLADVVGDRAVEIHTVQFFYRGESGVLEALADRFGGTYTFVQSEGSDAPATPDPLAELMAERSAAR